MGDGAWSERVGGTRAHVSILQTKADQKKLSKVRQIVRKHRSHA
jgi:hypothetical protein